MSSHLSVASSPDAIAGSDELVPPSFNGGSGGSGPRDVPGDLNHDAQASRRGVPSRKDGTRASSGVFSIAQAVLISAQQLAENCEIPGVSEAATMVSILVSLVTDHRDNIGRTEREAKRCRSIVVMLQRASEVLGTVGPQHVCARCPAVGYMVAFTEGLAFFLE